MVYGSGSWGQDGDGDGVMVVGGSCDGLVGGRTNFDPGDNSCTPFDPGSIFPSGVTLGLF